MKNILLWCVLLFSILLAACGKAAPTQQSLPSPAPLPTLQQISSLTGKWTVSMRLSGGIAGLSRSIEISSDGAVVAKDERNGKTAKRQLTSDELTQFADLVKSASFKSQGGGLTGCADCFNYNIEISSNSEKFTTQFDDTNLSDSGMGPVAEYLRKLMSQMLASG